MSFAPEMNADDDELLLIRFNSRDGDAFTQLYARYYSELYRFAVRIFEQSALSVEDSLQDIMLNLWEKRSRKFKSLEEIKAYLYVCVKNRLRNYLTHSNYIHRYREMCHDETRFMNEVAENEIVSAIYEAADLLPQECARVFRMHLDGWSINDIANELGKTESTVYKQRTHAIDLVKKKILKQLSVFFNLLW